MDRFKMLPIGIEDFKEIITQNFYYIDNQRNDKQKHKNDCRRSHYFYYSKLRIHTYAPPFIDS